MTSLSLSEQERREAARPPVPNGPPGSGESRTQRPAAAATGTDAAVPRGKRSPRARAETPRWGAFRLPAPTPPAATRCQDCGAIETAQWRSGPLGPRTLYNNCGVRRRLAGERWGKPRPRRPRKAAARAVSDQPPQTEESRLTPESPPDAQICEQKLAPAPNLVLVTSPPPATESLTAQATARTGSASDSEQPSPQEIPASESSSQQERAKRKSPSPTMEPLPPNNKKNKKTAEKLCKHCGSSETPQWSEGAKGPRTLRNACGVRNRQGRLLPEYRPQASPTFEAEHASSHSGVLELRRKRKNKQQEPPPPLAQPQPVDDSQDVDLMPQPLPRRVDDIASKLRAGARANNDRSASNNAGAPRRTGPVAKRGRIKIHPFLLDGPARPMIVEPEAPC
ncbi:hypothetical protein PAHAL_3G043200 [Panicum hallii]|jgi:GATA-binding protein, other eukaryote|uniref:GATA-type domain-containing protein n=1 Tax=Panicum hallii TaxID=206008 RepID=A0A2S3H630_9POAL|nr:serine/arginine repetitive matrix protein 1-like [Panicum hallii]PAN16184.1 hypothetical protein PAHAL_3G043200 [Panicum hallii]